MKYLMGATINIQNFGFVEDAEQNKTFVLSAYISNSNLNLLSLHIIYIYACDTINLTN